MRNLKLHFWLLAFDVFACLRWRRAELWAIGKAGDATDWGEGADCSDGSGEEPW